MEWGGNTFFTVGVSVLRGVNERSQATNEPFRTGREDFVVHCLAVSYTPFEGRFSQLTHQTIDLALAAVAAS